MWNKTIRPVNFVLVIPFQTLYVELLYIFQSLENIILFFKHAH